MTTHSDDSTTDALSREADVRPQPERESARESTDQETSRDVDHADANPLTTDVPEKLAGEGVPGYGDDIAT